jgi:hypothetical protein
MVDSGLKNKFEQLHQLLIEERDCAKALDIEGLQQVVGRKAELLAELRPQAEDVLGLEELLKKIDRENRRNAYLLLTGLAWVRETMCFFGQSTVPQSYGGFGQSIKSRQEGHLMSGRV